MILQKLIKSGLPFKSKDSRVRFGLRSKFIFAFLMLVMFPFLTLGIIAYRQSAKVIEDSVYKFTLETMRQISKNVDYYIKEMERITQFPTTNEELLKYLENYNSLPGLEKVEVAGKLNKILINLSGLRSDLSGVYLFDTHNNIFYTRGRSPKLGYEYKSDKWYIDTLAKAGSINIIGTHLQYHVQNKPILVISVSREIRDFFTKKTLGVILVDFDYNLLGKIINNEFSNVFSAGNLYILDSRGTVIFNKDSDLLTKKFNYSFSQNILSQEYGTFTENINGQKMFVVFYTSPYSLWKIVNITPLNYILKDIIFIKNSIIIIMLICMVIVFIFSLEVSYKLIKPINSLVGAMSEMENGNLSASIEIKTNDETRLLAESFNSMAKNIKNLIEKVYHAQLSQKEAELNALQSQINPHFLYNTLESIRGVALSEGVQSIAVMVKALSNLFRYSSKGKEIVTIADEIEHVKNYVTIQNFRYVDKFEVEYNIDESLRSYKILKLILQPLVENSIYHGLETKLSPGKIVISCRKLEGMVQITISDNGYGIPRDKVIKLNESLEKNIPLSEGINNPDYTSKSVGIINVNARIKLYFGIEYGLKYESTEGVGTTVEIIIPPLSDVVSL